jgi:hypothetical protein
MLSIKHIVCDTYRNIQSHDDFLNLGSYTQERHFNAFQGFVVNNFTILFCHINNSFL